MIKDKPITISELADILEMTSKQLGHYARHPSFPDALPDTYPRQFSLTAVMRWFEQKPTQLDWSDGKKQAYKDDSDGLMTARELANAMDIDSKTFDYHARKSEFPQPKKTGRPKKYDPDEVKDWFMFNLGSVRWFGTVENEQTLMTVKQLCNALSITPGIFNKHEYEDGFPKPKKQRIPRRYDADEVRQWFRARQIDPFARRYRRKPKNTQPINFNNQALQIQFIAGHYDPPGKNKSRNTITRNQESPDFKVKLQR